MNFASDNFDKLYEYAIQLIKMGKAYVDHQVGEKEVYYDRLLKRLSVLVRLHRNVIVKVDARVFTDCSDD